MGLFVHDSDHLYSHMRWELGRAWQALAPRGWLVADDVDFHTAFLDWAATAGPRPLVVRQTVTGRCAGLLQKPA
jgi:hypothetical protein